MRAYISMLAAAGMLGSACSGDGRSPTPLAPTVRAPGAQATTMAVVSGDGQQGKAGEPLTAPFVVRVADDRGQGIGDVLVNFRVTSGRGTLAQGHDFLPGLSLRTDKQGQASVVFKPEDLGLSTVTASLAVGGQTAAFVTEATELVIERWGAYWDIGFIASPCFCSDVTVPVGTPVEWKVHAASSPPGTTFTVRSTSAPRPDLAFDSGVLTQASRFRFVPTIPGTWSYHDGITGHTATLTAR